VKLRANRLINMSGSLGRRWACASAILGLYFASFESYVYYSADGRVPDAACTAAAGARVGLWFWLGLGTAGYAAVGLGFRLGHCSWFAV